MVIRAVILAALVTLFIAPGQQAEAQTAAENRIVVLDIGKIRRDAASVRTIREQIVNFQKALQGDIQKEESELRAAQQELAKKQTLLAPEAFADERKKFEQRVVAVQQSVQQRRRDLESSQNRSMLQVDKALNEIVAKLATDNGYQVILRRSQVVLVANELDITDIVLKELDAVLPTVQVEAAAQ